MKRLVLMIFIASILSIPLFAQFQTDIILTSTDALWTDVRAYTNLNGAIAAIDVTKKRVLVIPNQITTGTTVVPSNITLRFEKEGNINVTGSLTIQSKNIEAHVDRPIFSGPGAVNFADGTVVRSAWFSSFYVAAVRTISSNVTLVVSRQETVSNTFALGNNVQLKFESPQSRLTMANGFTMSNIGQIDAGDYQIFASAGTGAFSFKDGVELNLKWFSMLRSIINYIGSTKATLYISGTNIVDYSDTVPANLLLDFSKRRGILSISTGITLTVSGIINAGPYQLFSGIGVVTLSGAITEVFPQWFGAKGDGATDDTVAITSAIAASAGRTLHFITGVYKHSTTLTFNRSGRLDFSNNSVSLTYTGTGGTAVIIAGNYIIDGMYIVRPSDFTDSAIGVEITGLRRSPKVDINVTGYPTGIKLNPGTLTPVAYNDFWLTLNGNKIGMYVTAQAGSFISQNKFYRFETSGPGSATAGYYGFKEDPAALGVIYDMTWYSPSCEGGLQYAFYFTGGVGRGNHTIVHPEFEGNTHNVFITGAYGPVTILGGISTGGNYTLAENDTPANTLITLDPRFPDTQMVYPNEGLYRGLSQGFSNLAINGDFENWVGAVVVGWTNGVTKESSIVKSGLSSAKLTVAGGSVSVAIEQALSADLLPYAKGRYLTLTGWIRTGNVTDNTFLTIYDNIAGYSYSNNATSLNTWTKVIVTKYIDPTATSVTFGIKTQATTSGITSYFDAFMLTLGHNSPEFSPRPWSDSMANSSNLGSYTNGTVNPSVANANILIIGNTVPTTISSLLNATPGQELLLIFSNANTTIAGGTIVLTAAYTSTTNSTLKLVYDGTIWHEVSRYMNIWPGSSAITTIGSANGVYLGQGNLAQVAALQTKTITITFSAVVGVVEASFGFYGGGTAAQGVLSIVAGGYLGLNGRYTTADMARVQVGTIVIGTTTKGDSYITFTVQNTSVSAAIDTNYTFKATCPVTITIS
jgi:hypothetical protein